MLLKSKNLPQNFQDVYVEGVNAHMHDDGDSSEEDRRGRDSKEKDDEDEDSNEQDGRHGLHELKIRVYNHTVEFKKNQRLVVSTATIIYASSPPLSSLIWQPGPHSSEEALILREEEYVQWLT